jgi:hypothetical protein
VENWLHQEFIGSFLIFSWHFLEFDSWRPMPMQVLKIGYKNKFLVKGLDDRLLSSRRTAGRGLRRLLCLLDLRLLLLGLLIRTFEIFESFAPPLTGRMRANCRLIVYNTQPSIMSFHDSDSSESRLCLKSWTVRPPVMQHAFQCKVYWV